jgi:hypothetical protein
MFRVQKAVRPTSVQEKLLLCAVLSISICWADAPLVKQLLQSALADSGNTVLATDDPAFLRLENALEALTPSDLESLLPTAMQCVRSARPRAQLTGQMFLVAVAMTPASSAVLDAYLDDFNAILSDSTNPNRRQSIIAVLEITRPSMSSKTIQLFLAHLQDKANTAEQTGAIAEALLHAAPANQGIVHQVLSLAEKRSEYDVRYPVVKEIGLSRIQVPEALDFVGKELDNPTGRSGAIVAASRLDREARARFAAQLSRIAQDPDEKPDIRGAAGAAINGN